METIPEQITNQITSPGKTRRGRGFLFVLAVFSGLVLFLIGGTAIYARVYRDQVYPGVYAGTYHLGKMTSHEIVDFVEGLNNRLAREGLTFLVSDKTGAINRVELPTILPQGDNSLELVRLNSEELARQAVGFGKNGNLAGRLFAPWKLRFVPMSLPAPVFVSEQELNIILPEKLNQFSDQPQDADIKITNLNTLDYEIVPEKAGQMFDYTKVIEQIKSNLSRLSFVEFNVVADNFAPTIFSTQLSDLKERLSLVFGYGSLGLNYVDPQNKIRRDWNLNSAQLSELIKVGKDEEGKIIIELNAQKVGKYFNEQIIPRIERPARDAKFEIIDGKVKKFQASYSGVGFDAEKTFDQLNLAFLERNYRPAEAVKTVAVVFSVVEPKVKMADANQFGIEEIVGMGVSTFRDSHTNRIKNIAHAVELLNGVLIKPGEIFSTIKYAGPFVIENGYLPEDVIKGKEIKKEVGGGMCQIGTTMFRMAMNTGLDITERRNHSLVVGYYADPVNGNPGTDATVYEPILDLKFLNDTGNYLLLQTEIDYKNQELRFTLWGKPDGRSGSYTHPLVSKWIPAGDPVEEESDTLKPGEKKCQNAFRGAVASFTYTRILPTGEKVERVFDSYYRPLPQICLVGKSPSSTPSGSGGVPSTTTPDIVLEEPTQ